MDVSDPLKIIGELPVSKQQAIFSVKSLTEG
jgi:hypothetical protein